MKGVAAPARAFVVFRARSIESRFEALHTDGLSALVGREEEIEILLRRWAKAKSGEGQIVLLGGEAGIGKSRLTAALMERLVDKPHIRLRYFCSPQHVDSAFHPIVAHIERAAGIVRDDGLREKLDKLDLLLQGDLDVQTRFGLVGRSAVVTERRTLPPRLKSPRNSAGKERWKRSSRK